MPAAQRTVGIRFTQTELFFITCFARSLLNHTKQSIYGGRTCQDRN